jgi:hypothetical protein
MEPLVAMAARLANQDPAPDTAEYLDMASRLLSAAAGMSPMSIRERFDEIACATNGDPAVKPMRHVREVDVAKAWLLSPATFSAITPAQQRRAVAARLVTETSLWDRVRRSWPLEVHLC